MNIKQINKKKIVLFITTTIAAILCATYFIYFFKPDNSKSPKPIVSRKQNLQLPDNRPEEIIGNTITLRRIKPEYFEDFHKILTPSVTAPLYFPKNPTYLWTKTFLEKEIKRELAGQLFFYLIFDNKEDKLIGFIDIRKQTTTGEFSCAIHEKYWGGGRFKEAVKLITQEYFKIKDIQSFIAHVEMWNLRSFYALKSAGFELVDLYYLEDGQLPRYLLKFNNPKYKNPGTSTKKAQKQK